MTLHVDGAPDTAADQAGGPENDGGHGTAAASAVSPPSGQLTCMACSHLSTEHDAIARRYCNATVEHALTRACICAVAPA